MLGSLRRRVVAIVVALAGLVLFAMLSYSYWRAYVDLWAQVDVSLERELSMDEFGGFFAQIGGMELEGEGQKGPEGGLGRYVARVSVSPGGVVSAFSDTNRVDEAVLDAVLEEALSSDSAGGRMREEQVAWASQVQESGWVTIAIADTSDVYALLRSQALTSGIAFVVGLFALFAIAWPLSAYLLRPVEAAWEQQRRFIADASHELKTPLAVIVANMGILERDAQLGDGQRRWVQSSATAAAQMQGLVSELLELARTDETISGDASAMHVEPVDFSDIVESATLEFDAVAFERGCTISSELVRGITLEGDREWLERLVKIVLDNAVKYAASGSEVQVQLSAGSGHSGGSRAVLAITNHGTPIAPEDLPHLFDRFYRSDAARTRATGGYGLGLAIAKGISEAHGGSITATSDEVHGTTFTIRL